MIYCTSKAIYSDNLKSLYLFRKRIHIPYSNERSTDVSYYVANADQVQEAINNGAMLITETELIALKWALS